MGIVRPEMATKAAIHDHEGSEQAHQEHNGDEGRSMI
jgi:hypothetical protein